jgi:hypothetical protein
MDASVERRLRLSEEVDPFARRDTNEAQVKRGNPVE